jgi:hypothetical protein
MPQLIVTLVDRTPSTKDHFKAAIMHALQEFLGDILFTNQEPTVVSARWVSQSPQQADQDLVIHWVENIGASYIQQKTGKSPTPGKGGFTHTFNGQRGSEVYRHRADHSHFPADAFAKLFAHEAIHNMTRGGNEIHGQGGLSDEPPLLPVNDHDRTIVQAALNNLPDQIL